VVAIQKWVSHGLVVPPLLSCVYIPHAYALTPGYARKMGSKSLSVVVPHAALPQTLTKEGESSLVTFRTMSARERTAASRARHELAGSGN
jgi:hypothetical protein